MTVDECVKASLEKNRDIKVAQNRLDTARANLLSSAGRLLPQISAGASYDVKDGKAMSYSLSANQAVFKGFSIINGINAASENVRAAEADLKDAVSRAAYEAKRWFISAYKHGEHLKVSEEIYSRRKIQAEIVKVRFNSGREHKGSYLMSVAQLKETEAEIKSAGRDLELTGMKLGAAIGFEDFTVIIAKGGVPLKKQPGEAPDFKALALVSPRVIKSEAMMRAAAHELNSSLAYFFPAISFTGSYGKSGDDFVFENESWRLGLGISLPVFEGFSNIVRAGNAGRSLSNAELSHGQAVIDAVIGLKEKWNAFKKAEDFYDAAGSYLEAAETRAQIAQAQYSAGLLSYDSWIIIENELVRYKKSYLDGAAALYLAEADWELQKGEY